MVLDLGELMLGSFIAFSLGFFVCRLLNLKARCSRRALWKETKAAERVMERLSPQERLGVLLASLPRPVVECYLDSLSPKEAKSVLSTLARYSKDGVGEVGDLLLHDSAMSILTQLSEDVPDLVAQLIFQLDPALEPHARDGQAFHVVASHTGKGVEDEHLWVGRTPSLE